MDFPDHTFPVPESEAYKLASIGEELSHHRLRANPWPLVLLALALGLVLRKIIR